MMHKPIQIKNLGFILPQKICFSDFNAQIFYSDRIAIIGQNGTGKTTLLNLLLGKIKPTNGQITHATDTTVGFVPQIVEEFDTLSGAERLQAAMTKALRHNPNILLLDEPTNHLDPHHRKSLMRMLQRYRGTLIMVSHDTHLLRHMTDVFWHIDHGQIQVFSGAYDDYIEKIRSHRFLLEKKIKRLDQQKKSSHMSLMKAQKRAAKSKTKGEKNICRRKWPTIVSAAKAGRAQETSGRQQAAIAHQKQNLIQQLSNLDLPESLVPKFSLNHADVGNQTIVSISNGSVSYTHREPLLQKIYLSIRAKDRVSIEGNNASGKSTLVKAILNNDDVIKSGDWYTPKIDDIGYLDQHYGTLSAEKTVLETITILMPNWSHVETRRHLSDFLFRHNEAVNTKVRDLSGGEKARLSLAQIAARTPKLMILDEITNNLDLETKAHVIQVLSNYPGAMIVIAHDTDFLAAIEITSTYRIIDGLLLYS